MVEKRDYYEVLGVGRDANEDGLRKAYRKLARQFHPDLHPGDKVAEERFKELAEAYAILSDSSKRATYDKLGHGGLGDIVSKMEDIFKGLEKMDKDQFYGNNHGTPSAGTERDKIFKHLKSSAGIFASGKSVDSPLVDTDLSSFSFENPMDFSGSYWGSSGQIKIHGTPEARKTINGLDMTNADLSKFDLQHVDLKNCKLGISPDESKGRSLVMGLTAKDCTFHDCDLTGRIFIGNENVFENVTFGPETKLDKVHFGARLKNVIIDTPHFDEVYLNAEIDGLTIRKEAADKIHSFFAATSVKNVKVVDAAGHEVEYDRFAHFGAKASVKKPRATAEEIAAEAEKAAAERRAAAEAAKKAAAESEHAITRFWKKGAGEKGLIITGSTIALAAIIYGGKKLFENKRETEKSQPWAERVSPPSSPTVQEANAR